MTLTAYAKHRETSGLRGNSHQSVAKAINTGRLKQAVARDAAGAVVGIADPELADQEWSSNTDTNRSPTAVDESGLAEAKARGEFWKAEIAELKFRKLAREVVSAKRCASVIADCFSTVRAKILATPSQLKLRLPHLTLADLDRIEKTLRDALEELHAERALEKVTGAPDDDDGDD